jgi:hypothetical protein
MFRVFETDPPFDDDPFEPDGEFELFELPSTCE